VTTFTTSDVARSHDTDQTYNYENIGVNIDITPASITMTTCRWP